MANMKAFFKSGHPPTLFAAFLYFDFSFAVWVLNGAMGPFISEQFHLSPAQIGLMVSVPTLAGAFMRFPLGVLSQYIGRKKAAIVEMSAIVLALVFGFLFVKSYNDVLAMGVLLGIAGASFGVALSLGSGWFPRQYKGLAMGIAGAGNSGTALAALFAPRLAMHFGWQRVYGFAAVMMLLPLIVMIVLAKEPPDIEHQTLRQHLSCLFEKDGWVFNLIYIITFGGFLGLATFLPSFYYSQFHVTKVQAGSLTVLATLTGSLTRVVGGWFADRVGGITTLSVVFLIAVAGLFGLMTAPSLLATTLLFMLCFAALGAGNGATFQLVPLRWPLTTAVAGGMIGEIGALGGGILPNLLGQSKQHTGSYRAGFILYAGLAIVVLIVMRLVARVWTRTWVTTGGRAIPSASMFVAESVRHGDLGEAVHAEAIV
ncbi:nitrate/nitrite transporter [Granulicella mallensis]|uniref:Major facilitator superfamily MFS_1 n=1 Tax=Granulicella mallensis (strain ATCC BAA-1857 / DSM 23137 / MP5ACTX8) TaxID=682795 RepID=G8NTL3_GRAMM|nr:MFS transporter [Granulicella mallensis]AEU35245.1 major facilitator superfamily MFS_1 [Granulicella mallensis MP5ACTX8]